jgi:hypothetical protein
VNVSEMDHARVGSVSASNASRRTSLRGVGLAGITGITGAAGLTSPFLATTNARASAGVILGCQAPGAREGDNGEALGWIAEVSAKSNNSQSSALGVRSYRGAVFNADGSNGLAAWWDSDALGGGSASGSPIFPGEQGSSRWPRSASTQFRLCRADEHIYRLATSPHIADERTLVRTASAAGREPRAARPAALWSAMATITDLLSSG